MSVVQEQRTIHVSWLGGSAPSTAGGVTWGVPWKQGELARDVALVLNDTDGREVPMQSWPTAFWPDGSVKWTAHAASLIVPKDGLASLRDPKEGFSMIKVDKVPPGSESENNIGADHEAPVGAQSEPPIGAEFESPLTVNITESIIEVDTGAIVCRLNRSGTSLIREIVRQGNRVCSDGRLVGIREERRLASGRETRVEEPLRSVIEGAAVEQAGPIRVVIKITGRHQSGEGRKWLPFTVRLYFYANQFSIRMTHTFLYDGNPHQDFVKGLGIRFSVPMRGPLYNRHVRLAGDSGWFGESPKGLMTFRLHGKQRELYERQTAGELISFDEEQDAALLSLLDDSAVWGGFKLVQQTCDSYTIMKRTKEGCSWIRSAMGARAGGLIYGGAEGGGLAVGMRRFWEKYPSALEVDGMAGEEAIMTVWLWSPDLPAMDLRHYDTETHVRSSYEGADELRSTPYGVGNTNELTLWCCDHTPDAATLDAMVRDKDFPPLLVCEPERYHETKALGSWSLPDRSTPVKERLEDTLDQLIAFYQDEIEQRRWYGFWDYGDVMHSYDPVRHTWRYDIGGCAWQNTELAPNIWLWYTFLRTGREDVFRMAEAMTRHTSEVDVYHIGEYAGLGSRHNVLHWGCGCKEARIGMAGLHKFYYYLTADERIGDIMNEVKDADYATLRLDPMRAYFAKDEFPTHTRSGPDWAAFCSNWIAQWERYEDTAYRDKMRRGIECLKRMPDRLLTGPVFGYDPKSGELLYMSDENYGRHLMICMGGAQVWAEMSSLLDDPEWDRMLIEYGEFYNLPKEEKERRTNGRIKGKDWNIPMLSTAMMAFSANREKNEPLARQAWDYLLNSDFHWSVGIPFKTDPVPRQEYIREIKEIPWISTNTVSQWSINVIICLEWIEAFLPESLEEGKSPA